ncbi:MAG: HAD family hydrolase [Bacillota bacterium]|uniref:HAD family hydrolase n=1 Tax=Desulforudis sp. DRI-14 TaxID=3459793 RepID=UPI003475D944
MLRYLLFDLDGTLLPMDMDKFLGAYLRLLAPRLSDYLAPERFVKELLISTEAMIVNNNPAKTNEEVFMDDFFGRTGLPKEELLPIFEDFYRRDFPSLVHATRPSATAALILKKAITKGYEVVIATNPIFPKLAVEERLRWVGVADFPFRLVTTYEEMHFCKPNPNYYREIIEKLGCTETACLMVGNDVEEDLVAGKTGMRTYLVEDCVINHKGYAYRADFQGSLEDLLAFVDSLPKVT